MDDQMAESRLDKIFQEQTPEPAVQAVVEPSEEEGVGEPRPTFRERMAITLGPARERFSAAFGRARNRLPAPRERDAAEPTSGPEPTGAGLGRLRDWLSTGSWVYALIAVLVIVAVLLPPISLPRRLGLTGYQRLDANTPSLSHPDGLTVSIEASGGGGSLAGTAGGIVQGSVRLNVTCVPMAIFLEGTAGDDQLAALQSIPPVLQLKSPYCEIDTPPGGSDTPITLEIVIPNDAEPWQTLDLYAWTGSEWEWIGGELDLENEVLVAHVDTVPPSVAVMQTSAVVPSVATVTTAHPEGEAGTLLSRILLPGLYLGTDGTLMGQVVAVTEETPEPLVYIRNGQEGQPVSAAPLNDLLADAETQEAHITSIVQVGEAANAAGIVLDYRGVTAEHGEEFSSFVSALAEALHAENRRLEIFLPTPTRGGEGWDTAGYDWAALGTAVDAVLLRLPDDPTAYGAGGEVETLLGWAVGQVSRYKLRVWVSSLSVDISTAGIQPVSLEQALSPFEQIQVSGEASLEPGTEVAFTLAGQVTNIVRDEAAGTYAITYRAADESVHTVCLGTPGFLARKLDWALRYHLGGVVVEGILDEGNMAGILGALEGYRTAAGLPQAPELEVTWTVTGPAPSEETVLLSQPDFRWVAPSEPGTYTVAAAIAGVSQGATELTVATLTPEPAATVTPTASLTTEEAACLRASFVTDVTVPDGTQFDSGEGFVKTWRVRNSGTCEWPENTVLVLSYSQLGGPESVPVGTVAVGEEVEFSVDLAAPAEDGSFDAMWVLKTGDTEIAGGSVTAVIRVGDAVVAGVGGGATANVAPVDAGSFELGGHVRDMGMPYADQMHYSGMNWTKVQVHYGQDVGGIVSGAHSRGFRVQLSGLGSPGMVTEPGFEQQYAAWAASMAAAGADAIEVWNEPNIDREWQIGHISPQAYTNLLCAAYNAIKAANPSTLVISAAPAPTGWFGGCGPNGCDDQPWMEGLYNAGAANCMDYIGAHHNAGATSPSARIGHPANPGDTHHSWFFLPQTELYYNIFRGTRQLFYTEMGYASQEGVPTFSDQFAWARGTDNAEQAAWLAEAVRLGINTGMVRCIIVWNIDFLRYGTDPQDGFAIIRPGGSCPACETLHGVLGTR
jgi:hypothetical protein